MSRSVRFESCVDSVWAAVASAEGGADRVEFCANLDVDGTTPALDLVIDTLARLSIPVCVMVRPRDGDFVYGSAELARMIADVEALAATGVHGIVVGALNTDHTVDERAMTRLLEASGSMLVTFHRAFDACADLDRALDTLIALGVDRVLTSGGARTATEGAATMRRLVERAGDDLVVMAGGGVRPHNVAQLVAATGVREVHARLITSAGATPAEARAARAVVADMKAALS